MAADPAALQATVLDSMIEQVLIEQAAAQANIVIDEAAVEAEYQANRALVASDAAWAQWLADNLLTEAEFRQQIYDLLIAGAMRDQIVSAAPEVASHVHARHILVRSESDAHDVLGQLQNGADFVALAAQYSQDVTTREQGGDLGWFIDGELLEPALSQVAFALEPGQIGGPVVTRLGYHIIQTLERDEQPLSPEKRVLLARLQFENWVRGLTFNAIVERYI
jgi:parvulin-like peptidyl-prolyl isomerase